MRFSEIAGETGIFVDGDWIEKKDQDAKGAVRLIQLADVGPGEFRDKSDRHITVEKADELHCTFLRKGDILIARLGDPLCKACVFPLDGLYITAVDVAILRIGSDVVNPKYLIYLLNSPWFKDQVKQYESGTTRKRISRKNLDRIEMIFPPLPEQERIVARIEELFSQLDAGVETLKKTKAQLAVYRQAVLKEAFEGRLTASGPEKIVRLGDYIETPRYGTSKKCSYDDGRDRTAVYRIPNIEHKNGRISHDDIKYAQFTESELDGIRLQQGDILIIRSNGSVSLVGRAAMVCDADITGTFAGYLMRLRISEPETLLPKILLLFLQSHQARIYIENKAKSTSGVHNINSTEISDLQMPLYDPDTQYAIIEAIESRLSVCDSIEQTVDTALQQAEAMRQSILKNAFEGKLT